MTEKYPTWLTGHVKEWAEKRLPTVTLCSTTGNELLEVWYYGDLLTVKGEPQSYIVDSDEAPGLVARPWCISEVVRAHEDCPELQAILDEYHKPVVIQDEVLGELTLDKDYDAFEGEIQWCGKDVRLSLEVNAESKPSWTRARNAAKRLVTDQETWDKAMRDFAAKNLTGLANNWLSQDEESARDPETAPITEEEFAQRILLTEVSVSPGGRFTAYYNDDDMFWGHAVEVSGSLKKGITYANLAG